MTRKTFLFSLMGSAAVRPVPAKTPVRITRIALTPIEGRFHRFVAMNSYDTAPKGHTYGNTLIRLFTDQGVEGVGVMEYAAPDDAFRKAVRALVGANPLDVYEMEGGRITRPAGAFQQLLTGYPHLDGPLFDLIGKLTNKPCYRLIGDSVRDRIEVYDGTLYFSDVWFRDRGVRAVLEETEEAVRKGYLGLKYKVGRGWKWMEEKAGLERDIETMLAVRKLVGPDVKVLADANNGWREKPEELTWRFLDRTQEANLYWIEEPFPEDPALYAKLLDRMRAANMKTLLADGENIRRSDQFAPYLKPRRLMDVLQMDIRRGGFLDNLRMARMGEEVGATSVPHNWGSQVGLFMGLHLAKAVRSVTAAEDDRSTCDVLEAEGYEFRGGHYTVSEAPGLGLRVIEKVYADKYKAGESVIS
jgi:L-alanine-DL-glutamate epimerase-like enolase superfamily enzyme